MEIQNLLNAVYRNNNLVNNDLISRLKVGDILKAKILAMVGDTITLEMNDKLTIEARDISMINYDIGDVVEFTVADIRDNTLLLKSNLSELALLENKLSDIGIKLNEENKELIELFLKNEIPITKENISTIMSTKNYYGKVAQLIKENDIPINFETIINDIKEVLKNLMQNSDFTGSDKIGQQALKTGVNENHNTSNIEFANMTNDVTNNITNNEISTPLKNIPIDLLNHNTSDVNLPFASEFLNGESRVTLEKLVFMMKNNLDFTPRDIILVDNLLEGKKNITNQIENLIKLLDEDIANRDSIDKAVVDKEIINKEIIDKEVVDKESNVKSYWSSDRVIEHTDFKDKLLTLLKKFDLGDIREKEKFQLAMKELFEGIEDIRSSVLNNENSPVINKHIEEIKASFDFINKLNDNMVFVQIPLHINNTHKNLDIYIKKDSKGRKKISSNNAKIFISLNTNNLDLVQVLIELNKKDINLNFKVYDEKIKKIIEANESMLSEKLKEQDFNNIIFKYNLSTDNLNIIDVDLNERKNRFNTLDLRV